MNWGDFQGKIAKIGLNKMENYKLWMTLFIKEKFK